MTKICPEIEETMQTEGIPVSVDVSFASSHFPKYKLGPDNQIVEEPKKDEKGPSVKNVVEKETEQLSEQHKRLSVRDLASKFDKNLAAAAKLANEAKLRDVASLEGHVMLKKLRDALECLRGRLAGGNKDDVEKAISMVEALAVKLTQNEGELIQEKFEVKKLANFLKQATEDAKKLVSQEKSFACAEIESAKAVVQRFGEAFEGQERKSENSRTKGHNVEKLVEEIQEARRIKLLHQPTKVMGMQHELHDIRTQIREKSIYSAKLQKELAISRRAEEQKSCHFSLEGKQSLGSCIKIRRCSDNAPDLSSCMIQWYRAASEDSRREAISGADQLEYAPEPCDVGRILQADIHFNGQKFTVVSDGPIDPAAGLQSYVGTLLRRSNMEFHVVISEMNGQDYSSRSTHVFTVGKTRIKLSRGWITKAREIYSVSMQLCGVRSKVNSPTKALFWQPRKGLSFVLTFESEQERNAAILLSRKHALDCNVALVGPDD